MQEPSQSEQITELPRRSFTAPSAALLVLNVVGAVLYVVAASRGGWAIPEERAAGIHTHGYMGNNSAKLAAQVIDTFVTKQRKLAGNLQNIASAKPDHTGGERDTVPDRPGGSVR